MRTRILIAVGALLCAVSAPAQTRSLHIEDLTWLEIRDAMAAGRTGAIIYAGGIEQNGPHMSLAKHNLIARHVAGEIAQRLGTALVYPVMPFSPAGDVVEKTGHMRFPGTVSLSSEVFLGVMRQVAQSAVAAGFKQVYLMGDHGGGQAELRLAAEGLDADARRKGARVYYVDVATEPGRQMNAYLAERKITPGGHAGVTETAQVVALDPEGRHVHRDRFAASAAGPEPATGVLVDPTPATAEMGRIFLDYKVASAVEQIRKATAPK
jgi:creatinine amidohydrolase/Fe(II)-dependent formamide hydrolase-like protein